MIDHPIHLPRLYAIIDAGLLANRVPPERLTAEICDFAEALARGGVTLLQYRAKKLSSREMLSHARELRRVLGPDRILIMNDRADLCLAAGFDGIHLGQDDLSPEGARTVLGNQLWIGVSTHNLEQAKRAAESEADYLAIGPVFATKTKENPDPVVGLEGVRAARALTSKPLVAIGGISRANACSVIEAGADSVAVIGDLLTDPAHAAEQFLDLLV
ncbi:MAG TPA: thiamine phosphate synthase [Terriglobales bacterium]|nr:thiamine phosphate synthase [Terriglobales bacterium]